jgi:hypothetical protein
MSCHGTQEVQSANDIVVVIKQWHQNTLSYCFQSCKVNYSIESANPLYSCQFRSSLLSNHVSTKNSSSLNMMNLEQENQSLAELCSWVMTIPDTKDSRGSDCKRLLLKRLLNCCSWVTPNTEDSRGSDCKLPIA